MRPPAQVGSRAGARTVGAGGNSIAFARDRSPATMVTFPAPATSNAACGFPALRFPVCFMPGVMRPIMLGALSAQLHSNPIAVKQLQFLVYPLPTPPRPAEAASIPGPPHVTPNLLFYPVLNEAETLAGVSDGEVIRPTPQHRIDQFDQPVHRSGKIRGHDVCCRSTEGVEGGMKPVL
jgi:hypothetical protein